MSRILRGDIRWADLNPVRGREQAGLRPVLILSHEIFNERSGTVIAVSITSQPLRLTHPTETFYNKSGMLPNPGGGKRADDGPGVISPDAKESSSDHLKRETSGIPRKTPV